MITTEYRLELEAAEAAWLIAQDACCSCHRHPPCAFCEDGFSLDLDEYLELSMMHPNIK
jgi:hypothetical protein